MFSIGVIAAKMEPPLVFLTGGYITTGTKQVNFDFNGALRVGLNPVPGEWYIKNPVNGIGEQYQIRYTLLAGVAPSSGTGTVTESWADIGSSSRATVILYWPGSNAGRVLIEIRNKATQAVVAVAKYWSQPSVAP